MSHFTESVLIILLSLSTFYCENSTTNTSTRTTEHSAWINSSEPWWFDDTLKDIAYYLRAHKFNEYDRRYETNPEAAQKIYFRMFPKPPLRSLHWEVKRYCEESLLECMDYFRRTLRSASAKRADDTSVVIFEQRWRMDRNMDQIRQVDEACKKSRRIDNIVAKPFEGPLERFQWRTTASYYMCWYTMKEEPLLRYVNAPCDNFAACLDEQFGTNNRDYRADDSKAFGCVTYSFCPDPCCPLKHVSHPEQCWNSTDCPCFRSNPEGKRDCQFERKNNVEFRWYRQENNHNTKFDFYACSDIVLNRWNVTCRCQQNGFKWSSRYGLCTDIDECTGSENVCKGESEACLNLPGSHRCVCQWGHVRSTKDGKCVPSAALEDIKLGSKQKSEKKKAKGFKVFYRKMLNKFFGKSSGANVFISYTSICLVLSLSFMKHIN